MKKGGNVPKYKSGTTTRDRDQRFGPELPSRDMPAGDRGMSVGGFGSAGGKGYGLRDIAVGGGELDIGVSRSGAPRITFSKRFAQGGAGKVRKGMMTEAGEITKPKKKK